MLPRICLKDNTLWLKDRLPNIKNTLKDRFGSYIQLQTALLPIRLYYGIIIFAIQTGKEGPYIKHIRRTAAALLTLLLCLGLFLPIPATAADLYFTAINDSIAPLTSGTMPFWSSGTLYVPYTVFDKNLNGVNVDLKLTATYSRPKNTVTVYNLRQQMLTFDLNTGTCRDELSGETYSSRAIMRNGKPYLSVDMVCNFFGLRWSYHTLSSIPQGYMVRIKNNSAALDDARFIDAAGITLAHRLRDYTQSLNPAESTTPSTDTPENGDTSQPPAADTNISAYLALRCTSGDNLPSILNTLDATGQHAVFFLTPQVLEEESALICRILGSGHGVGILADSSDEAELRRLLARGTHALESLLHTRTTLVYAPAKQQPALEEDGWICWNETLFLSPEEGVGAASFANSALSRLSGQRWTVYLTLEASQDGARILPTLLRRLSDEHFSLGTPLETRL